MAGLSTPFPVFNFILRLHLIPTAFTENGVTLDAMMDVATKHDPKL
jgi:hypothetical protein